MVEPPVIEPPNDTAVPSAPVLSPLQPASATSAVKEQPRPDMPPFQPPAATSAVSVVSIMGIALDAVEESGDGLVIGAVVGSLVGLGLIGIIIFVCCRRRFGYHGDLFK